MLYKKDNTIVNQCGFTIVNNTVQFNAPEWAYVCSLTIYPKSSAKGYVCSLMIQQFSLKRILNPSLSCLSELGTVSQGGAREEWMLEKAGLTVIQAQVDRGMIGHLLPQSKPVIIKARIRGVWWKYIRRRLMLCCIKSDL